VIFHRMGAVEGGRGGDWLRRDGTAGDGGILLLSGGKVHLRVYRPIRERKWKRMGRGGPKVARWQGQRRQRGHWRHLSKSRFPLVTGQQ
jgi:hypothetical protein